MSARVIESSYSEWLLDHLLTKCRKSERDAKKRALEVSRPNFNWEQTLRSYLVTDRSMKPQSIETNLDGLQTFAQFYPDLRVIDIDLMRDAMSKVRSRYSANTISIVRTAVRHWYCSIMDIRKIYDEDIKHIVRVPKKKARRVVERSQLLTIADMVEICSRSSKTWAAIWALDWDMAFRPGELCRLRYEDLKFDDNGYYLSLRRSKSEAPETHYLMTWLSFKYFLPYYRTHKSSGFMFTTNKGLQITPNNMKGVIRNFEKTLEKNLYPYLVRESGSTWWYNAKLLDIQSIKKRMGHDPKSTTFESHYLMLFPEDYNEAVLLASGDSITEREPYIQLKCKKCKTINPPKSEECFYCHAVLDQTNENFGEIAKTYELQEENERLRKELDRTNLEQMKLIDEKFAEIESRFERKFKEMKRERGAS